MRLFWSDPYLWLHAAGLVALPLSLGLCLLGFAVGSPFLPLWLEVGSVAILGIVPIFLMQWFRPFYIFSALVVAIRPEKLTPLQLRLLTRFKTPINKGFTLIVPVLLGVILWQIYRISPLAEEGAPFPPQWRILGLFLAGLGFLGANLFTQVPMSVLGVLLTSDATFQGTEAYPVEKVKADFTVFGLQVSKILPPVSHRGVSPLSSISPTMSSSSDTGDTTSVEE
jgi:hypothetical protein